MNENTVRVKDLSFELVLSHRGGIAPLVRRFPPNSGKRADYDALPHVRDAVGRRPGCIDVQPERLCARLLTLVLPSDIASERALPWISGVISETIRMHANCTFPSIDFHGKLERGVEGSGEEQHKVLKLVSSHPVQWIAEVREAVRKVARELGFHVKPLREEETHVHITVCHDVSREPASHSIRNLSLYFDQFRVRARYSSAVPSNLRRLGDVLVVKIFPDDWPDTPDRVPLQSTSFRQVRQSLQTGSHDGASETRLILMSSSHIMEVNSDSLEEIAESVSQLELDTTNANVNAYISGVAPRTSFDGQAVLVLLTCSRNPAAFHRAMREIMDCVILDQGYAILRPHQHEAAKMALRLASRTLTSHHVVCSPEYEVEVEQVIESLNCNLRVRVRRRAEVPNAFAAQATLFGIDIEVKYSFLNLAPSFLGSTTSHDGVTVSTSQARDIANHRQ